MANKITQGLGFASLMISMVGCSGFHAQTISKGSIGNFFAATTAPRNRSVARVSTALRKPWFKLI